MGWDGFALTPDGYRVRGLKKDHPIAKTFVAQAEVARREGDGTMDNLLDHGGLDCSVCARAIEKMTGAGAWSDHTAQEVRLMAARADAYILEPGDTPWAFASAKAFLIASAANGCSYEASY